MTSRERIQHLFELYYEDRISREEETELMALIAGDPAAREVLPVLLQRHWESLPVADPQFSADQGAGILQHILGSGNKRVIPLYRHGWAAAAVILVLIMAGIILWQQRMPAPPQISQAQAPVILPGSNKAVLVLADGATVMLDSTGRQVIQQGRTTVSQQGGRLVYKAGNNDAMVSNNTLRTPKGGQFRLTLPDGTGVWLNAASSITYPTAFTGKERKVAVTGEVYFEVAANAAQPFMVKVNNATDIQVLGTQFNVNAYADEAAINTTLLQGSVRVAAGAGKSVVLRPGQQAQTSGENELRVLDHADTEQAVAWKNGVFNFNGKGLTEVMRQLARWYDIEVVFAGKAPERKFGGEIQRSLPLSAVLEILETMDVKFKIENEKKVIVLPG
ncbi:FecR family protein [Chitinophaga agrisoli]|uniref:FecR family protein n=1 Tax=Chitinophaga agrisoli TaxID=2607653 RepID=A0A5B2VIU6_9BACT|nr:FecR family protein [Chitinophaga agrisoli]KAA2239513.1 FecR family protein [Chitinophaga agrisoli]